MIYINDLDSGLMSKICKFADDTKLGIDAADPEAVVRLRDDLAKIGEWLEKWQMPFNNGKCHVLHVGSRNPRAGYDLLGSPITPTRKKLDLGVIVTSAFKVGPSALRQRGRPRKSWVT